jgi:hypothetical protein
VLRGPRPARPRRGSGGTELATRRVIAGTARCHPDSVSRHCAPIACDVRTHALLYDVDEAFEQLKAVWGRP